MAWYGMVWYGMAWYGMVWYGNYMMTLFFIAVTEPKIQSKVGEVEFFKDFSPVTTTIGQTITAMRGVALTLLCPVEGFPPPKISWRTNFRLLSATDERRGYKISTLNRTVGALVLNGTKLNSNEKMTFVCVASNVAGSTEVQSTVVLKGRVQKLSVINAILK